MVNNTIQWFPGHMHKARKEIEEAIPQVDVIIEVLDARIPFSSENPMISQLRGDKPVVKVLNKRDLADPELTQLWIDHFEQEKMSKRWPSQRLTLKKCIRLWNCAVSLHHTVKKSAKIFAL
mgnify:CR=1 FL=1